MTRVSLRFLAIAAICLSGCNPMSTSSTTTYATQNLTGNWQVGISDPSYPGPYPIASLSGAVTGQGQNITATLRAAGTGCVSPTQNIAFTGSQVANGTLTLTSTNLTNNVATITGAPASSSSGTLFLGSLTITGSGPCTMALIALRGQEFSPLTGTYTGSLTSTSGTSATFTAVLLQAAANSDGQFPESGSITVANSGCTNVFSLAGTVAGPTLTATLSLVSGPPATTTLATGPPSGTALSFSMTIAGTGCDAGAFTGSLTQQ